MQDIRCIASWGNCCLSHMTHSCGVPASCWIHLSHLTVLCLWWHDVLRGIWSARMEAKCGVRINPCKQFVIWILISADEETEDWSTDHCCVPCEILSVSPHFTLWVHPGWSVSFERWRGAEQLLVLLSSSPPSQRQQTDSPHKAPAVTWTGLDSLKWVLLSVFAWANKCQTLWRRCFGSGWR